MKIKTQIISIAVTIILFTISCDKYFDVTPTTTSVNPTTMKDFEEMLNSDSIASCNYFLMDIMSDDIALRQTVIDTKEIYFKNAYYWNQNIWNPADEDISYNRSYSKILQMNIILDRIDGAKLENNDTEQSKWLIKAQAYINRAWYYLQLVNCYGNAYDAATAQSDLGVPIVLKPNATNLSSRATVADVYNVILSDLQYAISVPNLESMGVNILHPGKAAAYALLARTFLYMANYDSAQFYADKTLSLKDTLRTYSSYIKPTKLYDLSQNPEVLMARFGTELNFYNNYSSPISLSTELSTLMPITDYRRSKNFIGSNYNMSNTSQLTFDYSLKTAEVYLIKAECLARSGNGSAAVDILNNLRKKRLETYTALTSNGNDVLKLVLDERRKELLYMGGIRFFDLKRLNKETLYKKNITRMNDAGTSVLATLSAGSPRYLMQFSPVLIGNNPNIIQNIR